MPPTYNTRALQQETMTIGTRTWCRNIILEVSLIGGIWSGAADLRTTVTFLCLCNACALPLVARCGALTRLARLSGLLVFLSNTLS